jgi:flagellar motor switch protein FliM
MTEENDPREGGEDTARAETQVYNFRRPNRLSSEQIRRIEYLHASLPKRVNVSLSGLFRDYVEVTVGSIQEVHWSDFVRSISDPCVVFTFGADPLEGTGVIGIDPALAFGFVDRLFGGGGDGLDSPREVTAIERRVIGKVVDVILKEIEFAWSSLGKIKAAVESFTSSPDFIQTSGIDQSLILTTLNVKTARVEGKIEVGYPHLMFEPLIRAAVKRPPAGRKREGVRETTGGLVRKVPLSLAARLEPTWVGIGDLLQLKSGDVLMLDNRVSDEVVVSVGEREILRGLPGRSEGNTAVRITRFSHKEGD